MDVLQGDAQKAHRVLGWTPKASFRELVEMMVAHDLELASKERLLRDAGYALAGSGSW